MKTLTTMFVLGGLVVFSLPLYVYAQTYGYINTSGLLQVISANTPQEAIAGAPNRAEHSGVMVMGTATTVPANPNTEIYEYVSTSGLLRTIVATSPQEALALATDRAEHSGVMLLVK